MSEWIVRVLPLPVRDPFLSTEPQREELARFRLRILAPHERPGLHRHGPRVASFEVGRVRILALDTANPDGGVGGCLDSDQCRWLVRELEQARDRYVVIASHDGAATLMNGATAPGEAPRVLGPELVSVLLAHRSVIAWVSATLHARAGRRHGDAGHGFWELPGATTGPGSPLAGGVAVTAEERHLDRVVVLRGALGDHHGAGWEVRDPLHRPQELPSTVHPGAGPA